MKLVLLVLLGIGCLGGLAGCGSAEASPAPSAQETASAPSTAKPALQPPVVDAAMIRRPESPEAAMEELTGFLEKLAIAADKNAGDCERTASEMEAIALADGPRVAVVAMAVTPEDQQRFGPKFERRGKVAADKVAEAMASTCRDKPGALRIEAALRALSPSP